MTTNMSFATSKPQNEKKRSEDLTAMKAMIDDKTEYSEHDTSGLLPSNIESKIHKTQETKS